MKMPQEVYDTVATHLIKQNKKSLNQYGRCVYKGVDGTSCAMGCLIPDDMYTVNMEEFNLYDLTRMFPSDVFNYFEHYALLQCLQGLHDKVNPEWWPSGLVKIAQMFKLQPIHM